MIDVGSNPKLVYDFLLVNYTSLHLCRTFFYAVVVKYSLNCCLCLVNVNQTETLTTENLSTGVSDSKR